MPKTYRLTLAIPSQNTAARQHWTVANRQVKDWRAAIRAGLTDLVGLDLRWSVWHFTRLIPKRGKLMDDSNIVGGCKPLVDALTHNNIIFDDATNYFHATYCQTKIADHTQATQLEAEKTLTLITLLEARS